MSSAERDCLVGVEDHSSTDVFLTQRINFLNLVNTSFSSSFGVSFSSLSWAFPIQPTLRRDLARTVSHELSLHSQHHSWPVSSSLATVHMLLPLPPIPQIFFSFPDLMGINFFDRFSSRTLVYSFAVSSHV
jgi:hypothetical protein